MTERPFVCDREKCSTSPRSHATIGPLTARLSPALLNRDVIVTRLLLNTKSLQELLLKNPTVGSRVSRHVDSIMILNPLGGLGDHMDQIWLLLNVLFLSFGSVQMERCNMLNLN